MLQRTSSSEMRKLRSFRQLRSFPARQKTRVCNV